ncbi:MAG: HD domain-containing protein [bacterium]|nr:HD domain-containing protein [bacterium]
MEINNALGRLLICSANTNDVFMLRGLLLGSGYNVQACSSFEKLMLQMQKEAPHVLLFDDTISRENVKEICALRTKDSKLACLQLIGIVPFMNLEYECCLYKCGADSVVYKPMNGEQILNRVGAAFERSIFLEDREMSGEKTFELGKQLGDDKAVEAERKSFEELLFTLTSAFHGREISSAGHPERVAENARKLGKRIGLSEAEQLLLYKGGLLHDIGMVKVPRAILYKNGALDNSEYEIVKNHPVWGEELCRPLRSLRDVLPLVRHHHERMNGSGYPDGLKGEEISILVRIMAICEVYDALISDRPHRPGFNREDAVSSLLMQAKNDLLDKELVEAFIQMLDEIE